MEYVSMARSENPHLIPKRTMIWRIGWSNLSDFFSW
jgi:hypothetical protein